MRAARAILTGLGFAILAGNAAAAPLGVPSLAPGENIKQETGEITGPYVGTITVVRYTWRDSASRTRSVSLVPASPTNSGYAVQMSFQTAALATVYANATTENGDGGFGYFVSHELFRSFIGLPDQGTIASLNMEDDSPLGRYLPSTGTDNSVGANQAVHEYRLNYRRWGTVAAIPQPDPDVAISPNTNTHQLFILPVVIRWTFIAGRDYPLWSVDYDLTGAADHIATDVRGPYGAMDFNEGIAPKVTGLKWGDGKRLFAADAGAADLGLTAQSANGVNWTWNTLQPANGRRYNVLYAGNYELGIVDTVLAANSKYGDGYADHRGQVKAAGATCGYGMLSLPCDYEWAYQSFQYDYDPARPKLAWGTSPFLGTSYTQAFDGVEQVNLVGAKGRISYGVRIVFDKTGAGAQQTVILATTAVEADAMLTIPAPTAGGSVTYKILGDSGGPYSASAQTKAWSSVRLTATPTAGYHLQSWGGACAGVTGSICMLATVGATNVSATFVADGVDPTGDADGDGIPNGVEPLEGRNPNVKDNDVFTSARLFAMQQYRDFLGREGDAGGITFYTNGINGGTIPRPQVIENFFLSPEFGGVVAPVTRLYFAFFNRIPDYPGLTFQVNAYRSGTPLSVIAGNFAASPEFIATYGSLNNTQYVTLLYQNVLGRAPSQAEINFYVNMLTSGTSRGQVMLNFSESPEYQNLKFNAVYVTNMYVGMLRRAPEQAGFDFWVAYMAGGSSGQALIAGFLNAPEYRSRFLP